MEEKVTLEVQSAMGDVSGRVPLQECAGQRGAREIRSEESQGKGLSSFSKINTDYMWKEVNAHIRVKIQDHPDRN